MNRYLDAVNLETLLLKVLLQHMQVAIQVVFDGTRFRKDASNDTIERALGPDFETAEGVRLQLDADFAFPVVQLKSYPFRELQNEVARLL